MRRRAFLRALGGAAAGVGLSNVAPLVGCARGRAALPRHWAWVHGGREGDGAQWRERFARLRHAGITGVLVGRGDVETVSGAAHAEGLAYHRWIWTLNRAGDRWTAARHPEWYTVSREGRSSLEHPPYVGYYQWVCPSREPVRAYLASLVGDIASDPRVDGVHLDYIRHADVILPRGLWARYGLVQDREHPEFDFCYCEVCREDFRAQTGTDPLDLPDPTQDLPWRAFRWDAVTGVVRTLAAAVHAHGKPISAAVFPTPAIARRLVRQAWDEWPLDAVFPMQYHGFYEEDVAWIGEATREGVAALPATTPLHSGLYLPSLTPDELGAAVRHALGAGAAGVALFESNGLTDEHLAELREALGAWRPAN